jgi:hypothetical protein
MRQRALPAHQVGRLWKCKVSEVDRWLQAGKTGARPITNKDDAGIEP